jgi:hypothetical protein
MKKKIKEEFISPIEIGGNLQKKVILLLEKKTGIKFVKTVSETEEPIGIPNVWLWNQISDPDLNPNDYLRIEDEHIELKWLMTSCLGISKIEEILKPRASDEDCGLGLEEKIVFNPNAIKLKEVIKKFRAENCSNKSNKKICHKRHFFVGVGLYKNYLGIHILSYPEFNEEQKAKMDNHNLTIIKDAIYQNHLKWLVQNSKPTKEEMKKERSRIVTEYSKELRRLLSSMP